MSSEVLIVEDLDSDFEMVSRGFRQRGADVQIRRARGVEETTSLMEETTTPPALIVLDLRLMDGDGMELLQIFRSDEAWSRSPVVIWSARNDSQVRKLCSQDGVLAYFQKVADLKVVRQTVQRITECLNPN